MAELVEKFDAAKDNANEVALNGFLSALSNDIRTRLDAENEGKTIDPKISVTLPTAINARDVERMSAYSGIRSVCASPTRDFGLMITTLTDTAGTPLSTTVCVDMDQTFRSSMTQNTDTIRGHVEDNRIKGAASAVLIVVFNQAVDIDGKSFKSAYIPPKVSEENKLRPGQSVEAAIAPQTSSGSSLYVQKVKGRF